MKAKLHIPTEQYGFIELEVEGELDGIRAEYSRVKNYFDDIGEGLNPQEWARFRNDYMNRGVIDDEETYSRMNKFQKAVINQIKLGLNQFKENGN